MLATSEPDEANEFHMKHALCLSFFIVLTALNPVRAADAPPLTRELQPLEISVGKWLYHGEDFATPGQAAGKWTWSEECRWSSHHAFVTCSFVMEEADKTLKSESVTTYNYEDKSYWHYEVFDSDISGADPFVSRMAIAGDTWTDTGKADKKTYRVTYHYSSPTNVNVRIELSDDNIHWTKVAEGDGVKQL